MKIIKVHNGDVFQTYKNICETLEERILSGKAKEKQFEEWRRYFNWRNSGRKFIIIEKYKKPKPLPEKQEYSYKAIYIPVKCSKPDYKYLIQCNKWSASVWNACVQQDKQFYKQEGKYMPDSELQTFVKGISPLHAVGNQHVQRKYCMARRGCFESIKMKHKDSKNVKLPYKEKRFFNTGWTIAGFIIDYDNKIIKLARAIDENKKRQTPVKCYCKTIPQNIVEIELKYKNGLYLVIKYKEIKTNKNIKSNNASSIDLGEIHSITSIDNNGNALIITGRKMRSIKRFRDKEMAVLRSKLAKCTKGSRRYKKLNKALYRLKYKTENQINDCIHKISKLYLDYCIENNISKVYYGMLDGCTRNTKGRVSTKVGQKLNEWNYGQLMLQLENKLSRYGIELIEISEAYTSQTCPSCGQLNKPNGRNYVCKHCNYIQHRDIVGAINILNFNENTKVTRYKTKKYLRIA